MISVLGYGSGNVKAICNILGALRLPHKIAQSVEQLNGATRIILPGVGAFDHTMLLLEQSGMLPELHRLVLDIGLPVLGICVGMQVMGGSSEEGTAKGLGWIDGDVVELDTSRLAGKPRLPHLGWNAIELERASPLFDDVDFDKGFYFLHSYCFQCNGRETVLASSTYGQRFTCAVQAANIYGVQFHPEKSHKNGVSIFRNFAQL